MEKVKEVINKVTHKDQSSTTGTHTTGTHATGSHTTGNHGTHTTSTHGSGLSGSHQTTAGPHDSNIANKADPRVDSDRDGLGTAQHAVPGSTGQSSGLTGSHQTGGLTGSHQSGYGNTTAGPHDSNLANRADPRVDSDRSNAGYGQSGVTGSHNTGTGYGTGSTTAGPHSSNIANKLDPRVDSDLDGQGTAQRAIPGSTGHNTGSGVTGSHQTGGLTGSHNAGYGSTNAGPHDSNFANIADPRVDSDRSNAGYGNTSSGLTGSHQQGGLTGTHTSHHDLARDGPAANTTGPHKQDMLNKLDPRVDSDHSKQNTGMGQNQQY